MLSSALILMKHIAFVSRHDTKVLFCSLSPSQRAREVIISYIYIHSGISKSPLSLSTATRMTFIEEKFEVYQGKHYQSMGRSWSRNEFWYWSLICIDVGMKIVYWTFKFSDSTEFLSDKKCLYNRYSVTVCENSGGNFLVPFWWLHM